MQSEGGTLVVVAQLEPPELRHRLGVFAQLDGVDGAAQRQYLLDRGVEVGHPEEDIRAGALVAPRGSRLGRSVC